MSAQASSRGRPILTFSFMSHGTTGRPGQPSQISAPPRTLIIIEDDDSEPDSGSAPQIRPSNKRTSDIDERRQVKRRKTGRSSVNHRHASSSQPASPSTPRQFIEISDSDDELTLLERAKERRRHPRVNSSVEKQKKKSTRFDASSLLGDWGVNEQGKPVFSLDFDMNDDEPDQAESSRQATARAVIAPKKSATGTQRVIDIIEIEDSDTEGATSVLLLPVASPVRDTQFPFPNDPLPFDVNALKPQNGTPPSSSIFEFGQPDYQASPPPSPTQPFPFAKSAFNPGQLLLLASAIRLF
ncbi:hypothetical protein DL96DRAFT_275868 [Flagelloscypha sp. PMI_526]|nr:hypothetical protein DL96DRAFT_275868 [Flagelloscypha sp. PMI_526]